MTIPAGLSGLKAAADMLKMLRDGLKEGRINPDEIGGRIGEIYDYIIDSKAALVDAQEENVNLRAEVQELKSRLEEKGRVTLHDGACWRRTDSGEQGPFCPSCWQLNEKLVQGQINCVEEGYVKFFCNHHKGTFTFDVPERLVTNLPLDPHRGFGDDSDFTIIPGPRR